MSDQVAVGVLGQLDRNLSEQVDKTALYRADGHQ